MFLSVFWSILTTFRLIDEYYFYYPDLWWWILILFSHRKHRRMWFCARSSVFFLDVKKKVTREEFWNFGRERKKCPWKKLKKPQKVPVKIDFCPWKFSKITPVKTEIVRVKKKNQKFCPLKVKKLVKIPEILGVKL